MGTFFVQNSTSQRRDTFNTICVLIGFSILLIIYGISQYMHLSPQSIYHDDGVNQYIQLSQPIYHEKQMTITSAEIKMENNKYVYIATLTYNYNNCSIDCKPMQLADNVNYEKLKQNVTASYPLNSTHKLYMATDNYVKCLRELPIVISPLIPIITGIFLIVLSFALIFNDCVVNNSD